MTEIEIKKVAETIQSVVKEEISEIKKQIIALQVIGGKWIKAEGASILLGVSDRRHLKYIAENNGIETARPRRERYYNVHDIYNYIDTSVINNRELTTKK